MPTHIQKRKENASLPIERYIDDELGPWPSLSTFLVFAVAVLALFLVILLADKYHDALSEIGLVQDAAMIDTIQLGP